MGLFSSKGTHLEDPSQSGISAAKSEAAAAKTSTYEAMVQNLIKASKTSMGFMGKSSTKAAAQMLLPNEIPVHAILTNVSLGDPQSGEEFKGKGLKDKTNGVLIITDQRLVFAGALGTPISKAVALTEIHTVDDSNVESVLHSVLRVETPDTILAIDGNRQVLTTFCIQLNTSIQKAKRRG